MYLTTGQKTYKGAANTMASKLTSPSMDFIYLKDTTEENLHNKKPTSSRKHLISSQQSRGSQRLVTNTQRREYHNAASNSRESQSIISSKQNRGTSSLISTSQTKIKGAHPAIQPTNASASALYRQTPRGNETFTRKQTANPRHAARARLHDNGKFKSREIVDQPQVSGDRHGQTRVPTGTRDQSRGAVGTRDTIGTRGTMGARGQFRGAMGTGQFRSIQTAFPSQRIKQSASAAANKLKSQSLGPFDFTPIAEEKEPTSHGGWDIAESPETQKR